MSLESLEPPVEPVKFGIAFAMTPGPQAEAAKAQLMIFGDAMNVYIARNERYKDNWKKMGWRGQLVRMKERVERLWDDFWGKEPIPDGVDELMNVDDAIDLINFAAFFIRAANDNNRDGDWWNGI